jgi:hypothetical protein
MGTEGVAYIQTILVPHDRGGRHRSALRRVAAARAVGARDHRHRLISRNSAGVIGSKANTIPGDARRIGEHARRTSPHARGYRTGLSD